MTDSNQSTNSSDRDEDYEHDMATIALLLSVMEKWYVNNCGKESLREVLERDESMDEAVAYTNQMVDYFEAHVDELTPNFRMAFESFRKIMVKISKNKGAAIKPLPSLYRLPNGSIMKSMHKMLANGGDPISSSVTRNDSWTKEEGKNEVGTPFVRLTHKSGRITEVFTITNYELVFPGTTADRRKRGTIGTRKLMPYVLQKANQQNFPEVVSIDLQEMVDMGMYKTVDVAWRALCQFVTRMETVDISITRGRKSEGGTIFYHRKRSKGAAYLFVNKNIDLRMFASQWTVFPRWAYSLGPLAFDIVYHIFYVARMNTKLISDGGCFNVSLMALVENTSVPSPDEVTNRKYKERIRDPIAKAIEEIEETVLKTQDAKGRFFITPYWDENESDIDKWLKGHIEVCLKGEYARDLVAFESKKQAKIEASIAKTGKRNGKKP